MNHKVCIGCETVSTSKWYSGPLCRKCYRAQPHIRCSERKHSSQWYIKNKQRAYKKTIEWREANKDKFIEQQRKWYQKNKNSEYQMNRKRKNCTKLRKNNINFKLASNLRNRLNKAIKGNQKTGSAIRDLGCSIKELKRHLETQFQEGMTWDNHGLKGWHIDHIKPLSSFDLTNEVQLKEACHYTNLQPLWASENLEKGKKSEIQRDRN